MSETVHQDVAIKGEGNIVVGRGDVIINPLPPAEARERHDLGILLKNVDTTWIKGVLEHSVHEAALLELGMETRADAVDHPWQMVLETPDQDRQPLPPGTQIKTIFDEANQLLLILGEPGSGKTTTLLQLARDLMAEIDPAFTQPIPIIFNLSTWTDRRQHLADWLIAELQGKYRVPKKQGHRWLEERRILPLLDGLDEVKLENRAACVERINQLVVDYGLQGVVVCSRVQDYAALDRRLQFNRAIYLQPLKTEQIENYFENAGDKLTHLRLALQQDEALQNLAKSPLMLNIMGMAYRDSPAEELSVSKLATEETIRQNLFNAYIARMFKRRGTRGANEVEQTKERLSWLAQNMQRHNQEVFLVEGLQPSWLEARRLRIVYILVSRLLGGLGIGLCLGLGYALNEGSMVGLGVGLFTWLVGGFSISLVDSLHFEWWQKRPGSVNTSNFWKSVTIVTSVVVMIGSSGSLFVWLSDGFGIGLSGDPVDNVLIFGLVIALSIGLVFGLLFGLPNSRQSYFDDIQTVEAMRWQWRKALKGFFISFIVFMIAILIFGLGVGLIFSKDEGLLSGLGSGLVVALVIGFFLIFYLGLGVGLMGAIFFGLSREIVETKTVPNQGIHLSLRNAFFGGLSVGLLVMLAVGLVFVQVWGIDIVLNVALAGLFFGLIGALWYGGLDFIQHYVLRLILIVQGLTPRNYARFLDSCVNLIFLQKVGGGYRFIHRMLLEHFAEIGQEHQ